MQHDHKVEFLQLERVKQHVRKHKREYATGAISLGTGVIIGCVLKSRPTMIINTVAPEIKPIFNIGTTD